MYLASHDETCINEPVICRENYRVLLIIATDKFNQFFCRLLYEPLEATERRFFLYTDLKVLVKGLNDFQDYYNIIIIIVLIIMLIILIYYYYYCYYSLILLIIF
jgi:hypothetical protein